MIRRATEKDVPQMLRMLGQVLEIHAAIRPDIFISGTTKYTEQDLIERFGDDAAPVYVATDENDTAVGYLICMLREQPFSTTMKPGKSLFIDDFCVDEAVRGRHIGEQLFRFACDEARRLGCRDITLNVWEGNNAARGFYERMGMRPRETQMEFTL